MKRTMNVPTVKSLCAKINSMQYFRRKMRMPIFLLRFTYPEENLFGIKGIKTNII